MELKRERIGYIDALKGFSIICVVLGHVLNGYISSDLWPAINDGLHDIYNFIYAFHMPLFFSISGYVYSLVYFDEDRCLKKQKIKTHLLDYAWIYVVFCVLMWGFKLLAADGVNQQISANAILLIWMRPINIYWYLYVLIAFYLFFIPLLQKPFDTRAVFTFLALVCMSSVLVSGQVGFQIHHILYFAIFFWIGACKQRNDNFILMKKWGATAAFLVAVVLMIVFWNSGKDYNQLPIANAFIALGLTCGFWTMFENIIGGGERLLSLCGRYCLEIYLMHVFVGSGIRILGLGTKVMGDMPILCIIINVLLSVFLPVVCAVVLRKTKLHDLLFKPYEYFVKR